MSGWNPLGAAHFFYRKETASPKRFRIEVVNNKDPFQCVRIAEADSVAECFRQAADNALETVEIKDEDLISGPIFHELDIKAFRTPDEPYGFRLEIIANDDPVEAACVIKARTMSEGFRMLSNHLDATFGKLRSPRGLLW